MANEEKKNTLGLDTVPDRKEAELSLVEGLLAAASFREDDDQQVTYEVRRAGKFYFKFTVRPLDNTDVQLASKKAGIYKPNPTNKKLGTVKVDTDSAKYNSWLIYLATIPKDQQEVWGNPVIMQKFGLMEPWESIDKLLMIGEKTDILEKILKLSGLNDEDDDETMDDEETAKN